MNEFEAISNFFKYLTPNGRGVIIGSGDDAACLEVPENHYLLVSTDTLVADRHFLSSWDAYDIAYKAVMVNISDMAAMSATPLWLTLSLTLPNIELPWMKKFSSGLKDALECFNVCLVGGDLTKGPLNISVTIHGIAQKNKVVTRAGAKAGDGIFVSGYLGAAAYVVKALEAGITESACPQEMVNKLKNPMPRVDLNDYLQEFASSAIDLSDGLSSDLSHICKSSAVGAMLEKIHIPIHPGVSQLDSERALGLALHGGDDYELCFTVPKELEDKLISTFQQHNKQCFKIGEITEGLAMQIKDENGLICELESQGYNHFNR